MCDERPLNWALTAAAGGVVTAIAGVIAAIALNGSYYYVAGSPAAIIVAGIAALAAATSLVAAIVAANAWFSCMVAERPSAAGPCKGTLENFNSAAGALAAVLFIQGYASLAAAGLAWVPWVGGVPMYAVLGALLVQAALIPSLIVFWQRMRDCIRTH